VPYREVDGEWTFEHNVPELATFIIGRAAEAEAAADQVGYAYLVLLPDEIIPVLAKPLRGADQVRLLRAAIAREGYDKDTRLGFRGLPDAFDRLQQVRSDLAHSDLIPVDLFHPVEYRLVSHRENPLKVLPPVVTVDILLAELERATDLLHGPMNGLLFRLGRLSLREVDAHGEHPPRTGRGPRPVVRDERGYPVEGP